MADARVIVTQRSMDVDPLRGFQHVIQESLASTFDVSKIVAAFDTLFGVISEQNHKISDLNHQVLKHSEEKLAMEATLNELLLKDLAKETALDSLQETKQLTDSQLQDRLVEMQELMNGFTETIKGLEAKITSLENTSNDPFLKTGQQLDLFSASAAAPKLAVFRQEHAHEFQNVDGHVHTKPPNRSKTPTPRSRPSSVRSLSGRLVPRSGSITVPSNGRPISAELGGMLITSLPPSRKSTPPELAKKAAPAVSNSPPHSASGSGEVDILVLDGISPRTDANNANAGSVKGSSRASSANKGSVESVDGASVSPHADSSEAAFAGGVASNKSDKEEGKTAKSAPVVPPLESSELKPSTAPPRHPRKTTSGRGKKSRNTTSGPPAAANSAPTTSHGRRHTFKFIDPDRKARIVEELRIRGEFIFAAKNFKEGMSENHINPSFLLNDRINQLEEELRFAHARIEQQQQVLDAVPERLNSILPNNFRLKWEEMDKLSTTISERGGIRRLYELASKPPSIAAMTSSKPASANKNVVDSPPTTATTVTPPQTANRSEESASEPVAAAPSTQLEPASAPTPVPRKKFDPASLPPAGNRQTVSSAGAQREKALSKSRRMSAAPNQRYTSSDQKSSRRPSMEEEPAAPVEAAPEAAAVEKEEPTEVIVTPKETVEVEPVETVAAPVDLDDSTDSVEKLVEPQVTIVEPEPEPAEEIAPSPIEEESEQMEVPVQNMYQPYDEIEELREMMQSQAQEFLTREEALSMLDLPQDGRMPVEELAVRLRSAIFSVILSIRSKSITKTEAEAILLAVGAYTDTPVKKRVDEIESRLEAFKSIREEMFTLSEWQKKLDRDLKENFVRFSQVEDSLVMRVDSMQARIASGLYSSQGSGNAISNYGGELSAEAMQALTTSMREVANEQAQSVANLVKDLKRLQSEVDVRPSSDKVENMIKLIESTFKRQLGENVVGLKLTVGQVLRAVQQKANKDDVIDLVTNRMAAMEEAMNEVVREELAVAGSVRCISCGHKYVPTGAEVLDQPSLEPDVQHGLELVTGRAGLRPLLRQKSPHTPKVHPYGVRKATAAPEPLYRKARLAAAMKEMTKQPTGSTSTGSIQALYSGQLLHLDDGSVTTAPTQLSKSGPVGQNLKQKYTERLKLLTANASITSTGIGDLEAGSSLEEGSVGSMPSRARTAGPLFPALTDKTDASGAEVLGEGGVSGSVVHRSTRGALASSSTRQAIASGKKSVEFSSSGYEDEEGGELN